MLDFAGRDPDIEVRRAAVGALAFSNSTTVSEALIKAISDEAWRVREMAAETIGKLKSQTVRTLLMSVTEDEYWRSACSRFAVSARSVMRAQYPQLSVL